MKKRAIYIWLMLAVIFVAVIIAMAIFTPKRKTLNYFYANKDILMKDISENKTPACSLDITFHYRHGEHPIMEYVIDGQGLVSSSKYYGFFYSYDGKPVAFQNSDIELVPISETEWEWNEKGDNHGYVEWMEGNWFYFEASF